MSLTLMHKAALGAFFCETGAACLLLQPAHSNKVLLAFFVLHALASLFASVIGWCLLPFHYRQPKRWVLALLFSLSFFIPLLGVIGFLLGVLFAQFMPHLHEKSAFMNIGALAYHSPKQQTADTRLRTGQWRSQLAETGAPMEVRVRALLAIHNVSARSSAATLRQMLSDQEDDLRLLAYGMLDALERRIMSEIHHALERLAVAKTDSARFHLHKQLAELYWELVYQNLVVGDMRQHALQEAQRFVTQMLEQDASDAGGYLLLGRINLQLNEWSAAGHALAMASTLGISSRRTDPYIAELAFQQHRYVEVRKRITRFRHRSGGQQLSQIADFWSRA